MIIAGYKQHVIKEWFANYFLHTSDITFDFTDDKQEMVVHSHKLDGNGKHSGVCDKSDCVKSFPIVTTDKAYKNK